MADSVADTVVALDAPDPVAPDPVAAVRAAAPDGVDRIVEVAFSDNVDLDAAMARNGTVIAAYSTRVPRPDVPFWPMLFDNVTIRLLGSDDFPPEAKMQAAADLAAAARDGEIAIRIDEPIPLERIVDAHELVQVGAPARVLVRVR